MESIDPLAFYGLKWNPFLPGVPTEACHRTPALISFSWRLRQHARDGGFALVTGAPGMGKSVSLRILVDDLDSESGIDVGILTRPQCNLADFYRELGELFAVELRPHNRWAGAKVLRQRWQDHVEASLMRPVLVIDEAQEMRSAVLNELRFLSTTQLDSGTLLMVVLAGDGRLTDRFREPDLLPLGSRIRLRLRIEPHSPDGLRDYLAHALAQAGNPRLMTDELIATLCDHAAGNLRALMTMAAEILDRGAQKEVKQLDEKVYFDTFEAAPHPEPSPSPRKGRASKRRSAT